VSRAKGFPCADSHVSVALGARLPGSARTEMGAGHDATRNRSFPPWPYGFRPQS